jgi:hypothetical protein
MVQIWAGLGDWARGIRAERRGRDTVLGCGCWRLWISSLRAVKVSQGMLMGSRGLAVCQLYMLRN